MRGGLTVFSSKQATKEETGDDEPLRQLPPSIPNSLAITATAQGAIRARLATLQEDEVFSELYLLAAHYERLAEFAESSGSLASIQD